ncbi:Uncharacterised protein [Segatella copri]|nr:Uncharacterised protein [Segatella copri]
MVQSLRVSASVNNLATISSYSGLTPMINSYIGFKCSILKSESYETI